MADYIDREAFVAEKRLLYCADCKRRKGMKNGKMKFLYETGDAPCRSCAVDDMLDDVEGYPAADVVPVVHGRWEPSKKYPGYVSCSRCNDCYVEPEWVTKLKWSYCPNCGCAMEGEA